MTNLPKFSRAAELGAQSFNEADNTVEVIWTTGAGVRRRDWQSGRFYTETLDVTPAAVRLERLNAGAPFLAVHDDTALSSVIGSVVPGTARLQGGKGYATIKLSRAEADKDIVEKIRDGIIRNISVGYAIHKVIKTDADGDGTDEEWRVVDWEPLEISAVPVPADAGSQIRSHGRGLHPVTIVTGEAAAIRQRMAERHTAAIGETNLEGLARSLRAIGRVEWGLADALSMARIAADLHADPVEAAIAAYQGLDGDDEERGGAYMAAFILAAQKQASASSQH